MSDAARWEARFQRERAARREAEGLLHEKSREMFLLNQDLEARAAALAVSLDELRAAQGQLIRQEKLAALGGLVAGVAHEINTPLGVAVTAVSLAREQLQAMAATVEGGRVSRADLRAALVGAQEALALAVSNLERGARLVQSFKNVAVDQNTGAVRRVEVDLLVGDVLGSLQPLLRRARAELRLTVLPGLCAEADAGALAQVLTHLVQNACQHAWGDDAPRRVLAVSAAFDGDALCLRVEDDGCGMDAETAGRVWEPFFTTRRGEGATGLGLHIVESLVSERFGGTITLDTAPGAGARWLVRLPFGTPALRWLDPDAPPAAGG